MLIQNATISHLSLNSSASISPIFLIPILSLSSSTNFYYNKIYASYSFSQFLNARKLNLLVVKNSVFLHFLSNVIKIDGELLEFRPTVKKCNFTQQSDPEAQFIGCLLEDTKETALDSRNSRLSVFHCNFIKCKSQVESGGGIHHENGYFRTDSNNFEACQSSKYGGGFYHSNGTIKLYRSSFYSNVALIAGSHFCVKDFTNSAVFIDYCFFTNVTDITSSSGFIHASKANIINSKEIILNFQHCDFNFTSDVLHKYCVNYSIIYDTSNCDFSDEKFYPISYDMREIESETFTPTPEFTESQYFTETTSFTQSIVFSKSSHFTNSFRFTSSNNFTGTNTFTPSDYFSKSSYFTYSAIFTASGNFTMSSEFTPSSAFTDSNFFSPSNFFSASSFFTESNSFTPSQSATPSYSPIPTRSLGPKPISTSTFTFSGSFTPSSGFTGSSSFTASMLQSSETFGPAIERLVATKKPLKGGSIMITLIVLGCILLLLGLIANIILCVQMVQAGEIIITQQM